MPEQRYARGVVIGKFRPPHRGHSFLIETARAQIEHLTCIVCRHAEDTIPAGLRAAWIRELHPDVEVLVVDDIYDPDDSRVWAENTIRWLGRAPDVVFTSEDYGPVYGRLMGAAHVMVDRNRVRVPISGSRVTVDPLGSWEYLAEPVRAYFARRVVVLGAESTDTPTLATALARHYRTAWVPEYGRVYYEGRMYTPGAVEWRTAEFVHIAREQQRLEDALARHANRVLICDTDALATCVWHERYVGTWAEEVERIAAERRYDLYILTGDEIPFQQDGTRDGEHIRHAMHCRFREVLAARDTPFITVTGNPEQRLTQATAAIDALLCAAGGVGPTGEASAPPGFPSSGSRTAART
jgi:HTH-type transcriptional regulator, transcriptional repressor of NAD biosynthesis genes